MGACCKCVRVLCEIVSVNEGVCARASLYMYLHCSLDTASMTETGSTSFVKII